MCRTAVARPGWTPAEIRPLPSRSTSRARRSPCDASHRRPSVVVLASTGFHQSLFASTRRAPVFTAGAVCRLVPALALLVACGGGDLVLPGQGEPSDIEVVRGNGQSGRVGAPLGNPVVALVTDAQARPVAGVAVAFALGDGTDATVTPDTIVTGPDGEAAFQVTMGPRVGSVSAAVLVS